MSSRKNAGRSAPPTNVGISSRLKRQGWTPVDVFFGEARPHSRPSVMPNEALQDAQGNIYIFVGTDSSGNPIVTQDERAFTKMREKLEQDRLHHETNTRTAADSGYVDPKTCADVYAFLVAYAALDLALAEDAQAAASTQAALTRAAGFGLARRHLRDISSSFDVLRDLPVSSPAFARFRAPLAQAERGSPESRLPRMGEVIREMLPVLRMHSEDLRELFQDNRAQKRVREVADACRAASVQETLQQLAGSAKASSLTKLASWIKDAAAAVGAAPSPVTETVVASTEAAALGEELREEKTKAALGIVPEEQSQVRQQILTDAIATLADTSPAPPTVLAAATAAAAAAPYDHVTKIGQQLGLSPDQEKAMMIRGKGIIAAGAGSGKTRVLAAKVNYHIEQGVPAGSIIATSFSRKSAGELFERIVKYGGDGLKLDDSSTVGFGTTHSLSFKLLKYFGKGARDTIKDYEGDKLVRLAMEQVKMGPTGIKPPDPKSLFDIPVTSAPPSGGGAKTPKQGLTFQQALAQIQSYGGRLSNFEKDFLDGMINPRNKWYRMNDSKTRGFRDPRGLTDKQRDIWQRIFDQYGVPYNVNNPAASGDPNFATGKRAAERTKDKDKGLRENYTYFSTPANQWFNMGLKLTSGPEGEEKPIPLGEFSSAISKLKGRAVSPSEAYAQELFPPEHCAVYAAYEWLKGPNGEPAFAGKADFDDLLLDVSRMMLENPTARAQIQKRFKVVLVDEAQDLNRAQHILFGLVTGYLDPAKIPQAAYAKKVSELAYDNGQMAADTYCFIGDDKQAIYEFRGADPEAFIDMSDLLEGGAGFKTSILDTNYRSGREIVEAANRLIAHNTKQIPMTCNPNPKRLDQGAVKNVRFAPMDARDMSVPAEWVADLIADRVATSGQGAAVSSSYDDFGLALRTRAEGMEYGLAMIKRGIPFRSKMNFFGDRTTKTLLAWLTIADEGLNGNVDRINAAVLEARGAPVSMLGKAFEERLTSSAQGNYIEWLYKNGGQVYGPKSKYTEYLRFFVQNLMKVAKIGKDVSPTEVLSQILTLQGFDGSSIGDAMVEAVRNDKELMAELMAASPTGSVSNAEIADEAMASIRPLQGLLEARADLTGAMSYVRDLKSASDKLASGEDSSTPAVTLNTMHGWKGLEVPTVIVPMVGGKFPRFDKIGDDAELASERRLGYVAITRGENECIILDIPTVRNTKAGPQVQKSPFIEELCVPATTPQSRTASYEDVDYDVLSEELDAYIDSYLSGGGELADSWGETMVPEIESPVIDEGFEGWDLDPYDL